MWEFSPFRFSLIEDTDNLHLVHQRLVLYRWSCVGKKTYRQVANNVLTYEYQWTYRLLADNVLALKSRLSYYSIIWNGGRYK